MTLRAVICKDDPTSHGGKVLEGNATATANGRPIAMKGHMTYCPQCNGNFPIIEGLNFHTFSGIGTAVEGMKTACGATLIATTTKGFMMIDDQTDAQQSAASIAGAPAPRSVPAHSGSFRAVDEISGAPVAGMPYRIELPDGSIVRGNTNADGYTERVAGHDPSSVKLYWENDKALGDA